MSSNRCRSLADLPGGGRRLVALETHVVEGVPVPAGAELELSADGTLRQLTLAEDHEIDGIPCQRANPVAVQRGRVWSATLAWDADIEGTPCASGSLLQVTYGTGRRTITRCTLARDAMILGHQAMGNTEVRMSPAGQLVSFTPAVGETIDGIPCKAGEPVVLSGDRLSQATLARDTVVHGIACRGGGRIVLAPGGRLWGALLAERTVVGGIALQAGTEATGLHARRPARGVLAEDQIVDGFRCRGGTVVTFADGRLESFVLAADHRIRRILFRSGTKVFFEHDGEPGLRVELSESQDVRGMRFPAGTRVAVEGWLRPRIIAELGGDAVFEGRRFARGSEIVLDRRGRLAKASPPDGAGQS